MERALYITRKEQLNRFDSKYSRLYFGNEFCQRLIPSEKELGQVLDFVVERNVDFTFLTPYVTNAGLGQIERLMLMVHTAKPDSEVAFNDWGVLSVIRENYPSLRPVMGRLLNKMKRGPRLMMFMNIMPKETIGYFQTCSLEVPEVQRFLVDNHVRRVELDNVLQGISLDLKATGISASIYVPYAYVTTTRLCLANRCEDPNSADWLGIAECRKECQSYCFTLRHPALPVPLISKGNTKFIRNEQLPSNPEDIGINRIVQEAEVPI